MSRVVREPECFETSGYSNMHRGRLEEAGKYPKRFKICPDSGKYGACGWMLSWLQAWQQWRAAGGPGTWAEWWAAAQAAKRDGTNAAA